MGGWESVPCEAALLPEDAQAAFDDAVSAIEYTAYTPVAPLNIINKILATASM